MVELLIVIVIVAILAAITVVAYNGLQDRARDSAVRSDLQNNSKIVMAYRAVNGVVPTYAQTQSDDDARLKFSESIYETVTYCHGESGAAFGAELVSGAKYTQVVGQSIERNDNANIGCVCLGAGIDGPGGADAPVAYAIGEPTWTFCANENQTCSFSGTRTVRYGAGHLWAVKHDVVGSISCTNSVFGDPHAGVVKVCEYQ